MTREEAAAQVIIRMLRHGGKARYLDLSDARRLIDEKYPREIYRTKEHPHRDHNFASADVLEMEREMRRRLRI